MNKINWGQKLSSRKFQAMIANFITNLLVVFNVPDNEIVQIVALISAGVGVVAYIFTEGYVDANREIIIEQPIEDAYSIGFQVDSEIEE